MDSDLTPTNPTCQNETVHFQSMKEILDLLIPQPCPYPLIRIGGSGDGSYLIPNDLEGITACYSPGVNNFKSFEDEMAIQHGIKCHMCDYSSDLDRFSTPLISGLQTFKKKWLDIDNSVDSISLLHWIQELDPDPNSDLILQIDIEGAEYRNLLDADTSTLNRFRIIVIEMHGFDAFADQELLSKDKDIETLIKKLGETHVPVHAHPNNCCGEIIEKTTGLNIPSVIEMTYLRKDRFRGDTRCFIEPKLPHPLDIRWNVRWNPPLHLNERWLTSGKRCLESELKVYIDQLDYARWNKDDTDRLSTQSIVSLNNTYQTAISNVLASSHYNYKQAISMYNHGTQRDYASAKRFLLRESFSDFPREGIVRSDCNFFFHTAFGYDQSITIDLEEVHKLDYLVVENRRDMCQDRALGLFYIAHNEIGFHPRNSLPLHTPESFISPGGEQSVTPLFAASARYITIFSPINTALHFSSVSLY